MCVMFHRNTGMLLFLRIHRQAMQIISVLKIPVYRNIVFSEIRYFKNDDEVVTQINKARGFSKQKQA